MGLPEYIDKYKHPVLANMDEETKDEWPHVIVHYRGHESVLAKPWGPRFRTDTYGNNRACNCPDLLKLDIFCVCYGICYCPSCGHSGCVGGHD